MNSLSSLSLELSYSLPLSVDTPSLSVLCATDCVLCVLCVCVCAACVCAVCVCCVCFVLCVCAVCVCCVCVFCALCVCFVCVLCVCALCVCFVCVLCVCFVCVLCVCFVCVCARACAFTHTVDTVTPNIKNSFLTTPRKTFEELCVLCPSYCFR